MLRMKYCFDQWIIIHQLQTDGTKENVAKRCKVKASTKHPKTCISLLIN